LSLALQKRRLRLVYQYNLIVIGAGSGGLVSAYIAAAVKSKVLLIEKHRMGGDCLNTGCVPSKALIRTASLLSMIRRHKEFGLDHAEAKFNFAEVMDRVQRVIKKIEPHDSVERYTSLGAECVRGEATLISPHEVKVGNKVYTTKNIILATGATPAIPPLQGLDKIKVLHTDNIWEIREQPKRLVIVGGGPIGCELGQCFARLGTKVIMVQRQSQLLVREDNEIIKIMEHRFTEEGIEILLDAQAKGVVQRDGKKFLMIEKDSKTSEVEFDQILMAVGRRTRVKGFGLEELGIQLTSRGLIKVDAYSRTNIPNIFACGDCASPYQFTHMAAHQAWYCAVNALFSPFKKFKVDYRTVPWCTYTDPEIARCGLNEKEAKEKNIPYEVSVYPLADLDRAITDEEDKGMVKVLTPPGKDRVLGVTICGHHAGDLLPEFVMAKMHGLGLNKILGTIHSYPTMSEANKFAAGVWKKSHAPQGLLNIIEKYHNIRRKL
jgi:dihydrolipoamide dehydrogenase